MPVDNAFLIEDVSAVFLKVNQLSALHTYMPSCGSRLSAREPHVIGCGDSEGQGATCNAVGGYGGHILGYWVERPGYCRPPEADDIFLFRRLISYQNYHINM